MFRHLQALSTTRSRQPPCRAIRLGYIRCSGDVSLEYGESWTDRARRCGRAAPGRVRPDADGLGRVPSPCRIVVCAFTTWSPTTTRRHDAVHGSRLAVPTNGPSAVT